MKRKVKITGKRQITIPAELFDELGLEVGQYLSVVEEGGSLRLSPEFTVKTAAETSVLDRLVGAADSPEGPVARDHDSILAKEAEG